VRVEPDEKFITALNREMQIFNFFVESVMEKIRATNEAPVPQGGLALRAALRASLLGDGDASHCHDFEYSESCFSGMQRADFFSAGRRVGLRKSGLVVDNP
jgi:hypothetical protein